MNRSSQIAEARKITYDIAIIGGGITGAGIFREATKRGYRCLLLEKSDFASGTSSKSAKLVHGGIRYLKYFQFGLVREGLRERNYLLRSFPHLVKPIPFIFPLYEHPLKYRIGLILYSLLGRQRNLPGYKFLGIRESLEAFPFLDKEGLRGAFIYYDAVTHDARLASFIIHSSLGNHFHALNYMELMAVTPVGEGLELESYDHEKGEITIFRSQYLINASGPWLENTSQRISGKKPNKAGPSKGIHLVCDRKDFPIRHSIIFPSGQEDERMMYALPWELNTVIVGTTDTEFSKDPDLAQPEAEDVNYILKSIGNYMPDLGFSREKIISSYAGIRPLIKEEGASKDRSRDYEIWWSNEKCLNIFGGKLTSFHSMAKQCLKHFGRKLPPPKRKGSSPAKAMKADPGIPKWMTAGYGPFADGLFECIQSDPSYSEKLHPDFNIKIGECVFLIREMNCRKLSDLLTRRLSLGYRLPAHPDRERIVAKIAGIFQKVLDWPGSKTDAEVNAYLHSLDSRIIE